MDSLALALSSLALSGHMHKCPQYMHIKYLVIYIYHVKKKPKTLIFDVILIRLILICRYVFEGLGHLVASILINSTQYLKRINENGIKKM